ncbi:RES family NAD+ phosphorylase [bacterium]|nr:RES family NAD+ phosphorylase [bacterium]
MHAPNILATVLASLKAIPIEATFHRSIANAVLYRKGRKPKLLFALGAGANGARFTPVGGPPCLYVSAKPITTISEATGIASSLIAAGQAIPQPHTAFSMRVKLHRGVIDLTDETTILELGSCAAELDGDWLEQMRSEEPILTQILATAIYESNRFQGIRFFSHGDPGQINLMIWTKKVKAPSFVEVIDSSSVLADRIPKLRKRLNATKLK